MSLLKDVTIETIRKMPENITIEDIVEEIYIIGDAIESLKTSKEEKTMTTEELINLEIPEEEISDEERREIRMIRDEMKRGKKFRLEDILEELNV